MDWWTQNKDAIGAIAAAIGGVVAIGGIIWAVIKWGFLRGWQRKLRVDVKVFEIITDPAVLLPKLFATENDNSPLADHRITYQPRDPNRDTQADLKATLNRSRYLLITAPTGYGKTREAGVLAQTMMLEGWRVLRIKTGWLDVPKTLPEELNNNRSRVLILLDDLNGLFSTGERTQSPRVEQIPLLSEAPYHDRLLQVLDILEGMCTESEIRVIATARSEAEQWKLLEYNEKDRLWKRFERIEISEPIDATIVNLLEDTIKQAELKADQNEFRAIAHKSDGTYRNILLNLRRCHSQNKPVSKDDFTDTLDGSWKDVYQRAVKKYVAVEYVYDAIEVLDQVGIELFPFLVEPTALMLWGGSIFQRLFRKQEVLLAIRYLTDTNILRLANGRLAPSDGQIDVKDSSRKWSDYAVGLEKIILEANKRNLGLLDESLNEFAIKCADLNYRNLAFRLWGKVSAKHNFYWLFQGAVSVHLNNFLDAEAAFRRGINRMPDNAMCYFSLGLAIEQLGRFDEAEVAYRKAIELNPSWGLAYYSLGSLLYEKLKRISEAEVLFTKALEIDLLDKYSLYSIIRIKSNLHESESVFAYLQEAIDRGFELEWTWQDPDLAWIRDDPRFMEIVGAKPEK